MMENDKRKIEDAKLQSENEISSRFRSRFSVENVCPACGARTRENSKFCRVCGKNVFEDYEPLDTLRASYRLQGKNLNFESAATREPESLFAENKNAASEMARAFVVYSLVPYLGILFCPGAFLMGGVGVLAAYRNPGLGGAKTSVYSIVLSFIVLAVQILLWWLLYLVPELKR